MALPLLPFLLLLLLLPPPSSPSSSSSSDLLVLTAEGPILGSRLPSPSPSIAFLGIPYAQAPLGSLRFRPPLPARPWSRPLDASSHRHVCFQAVDTAFPGFGGSEMWNPNRAMSEDCLYLNVWIPSPRPSHPIPVLVWIYGGGFYSGAASLDVYDGRVLASSQGVAVVSMNYRVGALGFLALPGHPDAPGNAGLWDQRLALRWIQRNIGAFGGDPAAVTLFGESAGAASIGIHLLSPGSRGLFRRAVLQSGSPNGPWATLGPKESRRRAKALGEALGCVGNDTELVACLRERPASALVEGEAAAAPRDSVFRFAFVPVVDGEFLRESPEEMMMGMMGSDGEGEGKQGEVHGGEPGVYGAEAGSHGGIRGAEAGSHGGIRGVNPGVYGAEAGSHGGIRGAEAGSHGGIRGVNPGVYGAEAGSHGGIRGVNPGVYGAEAGSHGGIRGAEAGSHGGIRGVNPGVYGAEAGSHGGIRGAEAGVYGVEAGSHGGIRGVNPGVYGAEAGSHGGIRGAEAGVYRGIHGADPGLHGGIHGTDPHIHGGIHGTDPGIHGTDPGSHRTDPGIHGGIHGTDPGIHGTDPGIHGTDPGIHGTDPGIHGTDPGIHGTDPGNHGALHGADGAPHKSPLARPQGALHGADPALHAPNPNPHAPNPNPHVPNPNPHAPNPNPHVPNPNPHAPNPNPHVPNPNPHVPNPVAHASLHSPLSSPNDPDSIDLLLGAVQDEGTYFLVYGVPGFGKDNESLISRAEFLQGVRMGVPQGNEVVSAAVELQYTDWMDPDNPVKNREALGAIVGDHNVVCPLMEFAGRWAERGKGRVFAYLFEHRASTLLWPQWMGVPHGYEIEFVFGQPLRPELNYTEEEKRLSERMMGYWGSFARTGDPNGGEEPATGARWPRFTARGQGYARLNTKPLSQGKGLRTQACAFWTRFLPKLLHATGPMEEAEHQWRQEFHRWSSYMGRWQSHFEHYSRMEPCQQL